MNRLNHKQILLMIVAGSLRTVTVVFVHAGSNKVTHGVTGAHEGGLFSICIMKDGTITTGGKDRRIVEWSSAYKRTGREHEVCSDLVMQPIRKKDKKRNMLCKNGCSVKVDVSQKCILSPVLSV